MIHQQFPFKTRHVHRRVHEKFQSPTHILDQIDTPSETFPLKILQNETSTRVHATNTSPSHIIDPPITLELPSLESLLQYLPATESFK